MNPLILLNAILALASAASPSAEPVEPWRVEPPPLGVPYEHVAIYETRCYAIGAQGGGLGNHAPSPYAPIERASPIIIPPRIASCWGWEYVGDYYAPYDGSPTNPYGGIVRPSGW